MSNKLYPIIAGPTASGKTALAISLAKAINGEVVSADSMQIYSEVSVGTARPDEAEMSGIVHHLMGFLPLDDHYSVARYQEDAANVFSDIFSRGKTPVMCGGTGLYIQSFIENRQLFDEEPDPTIRQQYMGLAEREGAEALLNRLRKVDPASAERLHPNDLHRIIRALEVYDTTGKTITQQTELSRSVPSPYTPFLICLDFRDRQKLYDRINTRVSLMLDNGLLNEARRVLQTNSDATVTQAIGYKEFQLFFKGQCSLDEAADRLRQQTRRYAKRQLSWFRRMDNTNTVYVDDYSSADQLAQEVINMYLEFARKEGMA